MADYLLEAETGNRLRLAACQLLETPRGYVVYFRVFDLTWGRSRSSLRDVNEQREGGKGVGM